MSSETKRFGEIAFELHYISTAELYEGLMVQARDEAQGEPHRFLGQILIELGHLSEKQVLEVLSILHDRPRQGTREL